MAGQSCFAAAAERVAVDGRDEWLCRVRDCVHDLVSIRSLGDVGDIGYIHARGKTLFACSRDDDCAGFPACFNFVYRVEKLLPDSQVHGVHRRTIQNNRRHKVFR